MTNNRSFNRGTIGQLYTITNQRITTNTLHNGTMEMSNEKVEM